MSNIAFALNPDTAAGITEIVAYHRDDAGQTFATVILDNGDVVDLDALDIFAKATAPHPAQRRDPARAANTFGAFQPFSTN